MTYRNRGISKQSAELILALETRIWRGDGVSHTTSKISKSTLSDIMGVSKQTGAKRIQRAKEQGYINIKNFDEDGTIYSFSYETLKAARAKKYGPPRSDTEIQRALDRHVYKLMCQEALLHQKEDLLSSLGLEDEDHELLNKILEKRHKTNLLRTLIHEEAERLGLKN